jgi:hypothetical protein
MLRITVHDNLRAVTFQLEGSVAGPWLRVLEECWQGTLARRRKPIVRVDLSGVTFIDASPLTNFEVAPLRLCPDGAATNQPRCNGCFQGRRM